jgi:hypothetical protein
MSDDPVVPSTADVIQIVQRVVDQLAPEELALVDQAADAWICGDLDSRSQGAPGGGVGSGIEVYLLCELLFPIISGAIGEVLGTIALEPTRLRRKKKQPPAAAAADKRPAGGPLVPLTVQQQEKLHTACLANAIAVGVPDERAALLANAIIGSMIR